MAFIVQSYGLVEGGVTPTVDQDPIVTSSRPVQLEEIVERGDALQLSEPGNVDRTRSGTCGHDYRVRYYRLLRCGNSEGVVREAVDPLHGGGGDLPSHGQQVIMKEGRQPISPYALREAWIVLDPVPMPQKPPWDVPFQQMVPGQLAGDGSPRPSLPAPRL